MQCFQFIGSFDGIELFALSLFIKGVICMKIDCFYMTSLTFNYIVVFEIIFLLSKELALSL